MSLEQKLASRIQQYIPDLRKQIRNQIVSQLSKTNKQVLAQKTAELRDKYTQMLKQKALSIKQNINSNVVGLHKQVNTLKQQLASIKHKKLSEQQKQSIIQQTIDGILNDQSMFNEIKSKLYIKVQEQVFRQIQNNLCVQLEEFQNQQQQALEQQRAQWQKQRYQYWRMQSQRDIQVLAEQHKQLQCKRVLIHQSLLAKKAQRDALLRQQNILAQTNSQIQFLKAQIKLLS